MANKYYRRYRGEFRTAYLQRAIPFDLKVDPDNSITGTIPGTHDITVRVGDIVKINVDELEQLVVTSDTSDASITAPTYTGNYIVAQSDMGLGITKPATDRGDYTYSDVVAASATVKKVMLYPILDAADLIITETLSFTTT